KALCQGGDLIFLESARQNRKWSRFSFLGINPGRTVEFREGRVIERRGGTTTTVDDDIFAFLKKEVRKFSSPSYPRFGDFNGGLAGFFSYELVNHAGILRGTIAESPDTPLALLMQIDDFIVYDNVKERYHVATSLYTAGDDDLEERYSRALERLESMEESILAMVKSTSLPYLPSRPSEVALRFGETRDSFVEKVKRTKDLITAGEAIQVVLSMRARIDDAIDPYSFYLKLRSVNPSPYMFFLKSGDLTIAGSSPEIHVKVERGRVFLKPIAGTVPQGKTRKENLANKQCLLSDEKERAEHLMLVDLARNDIARLSPGGGVTVEQFMVPEDYSHVIHLVSLVSAGLGGEHDIIDVLRETFPAGTVSGAPKVRAIEIIGGTESQPRGIYAGAVGYVGYNGFLDTCITIRTAVFSPKESYLQAGAGIVYDSVPEKEHAEILNKLGALTESLRYAKKEKEAANVPDGR
ncbi:MAG TPA: anthranilate synthase component I family protein, partial [Spirochaetota bacterium]|nr:anthranilate synthase component I family protein [Spirochaetota bacterium]